MSERKISKSCACFTDVGKVSLKRNEPKPEDAFVGNFARLVRRCALDGVMATIACKKVQDVWNPLAFWMIVCIVRSPLLVGKKCFSICC